MLGQSVPGGLSKENSKLSNKNTASKSQQRPFQLEQIRQILSKPAEQRTTFELRTVLTPLMSEIAFFKERKLKLQDLNEVCGGLQYQTNPSDSFIIHYGDRGDKFYIILKGTVSVWLPMPIEEMRRPI